MTLSGKTVGMAKQVHKSFWPATAITLSAWEATALLTGKPTITEVSRYIRRHRLGQLAIIGWTLGLLYHLLLSKANG